MKNVVHFRMMALCGRSLLGHVRVLHNNSQPIVVVAAARTPCGKYKGQLEPLSAWQLGQTAVDAAVKRSAISPEHIHHIFMNETQTLQQEHESKFIFTPFLKNANYMPIRIDDKPEMDSFLMAFEFIKSQPQNVAVAAGCVSSAKINAYNEKSLGDVENELVQDYVNKSLARFTKSQPEAVFESEIVPLKVQKQRGQNRVTEEIHNDEISTENIQLCDGASAVVLTSTGSAQALNLSPLAEIKGFEYLHNTTDILSRSFQCLEKLFAKVDVQPYQIKHWEIDDALPQLVHHLELSFNLNSDLINPHGGGQILGYSPSTSLTRLLTHICHVLNPSEYGCVISSSYRNSSALIVQKLFDTSSALRLPLVTLYTKNPCPLCDNLVEELELNFSGEYELQKVFIDTKENVRFLRLYRYDIPVVFLNNQFLCMHHLNHRLLRKRLNFLKNNTF